MLNASLENVDWVHLALYGEQGRGLMKRELNFGYQNDCRVS